jgi:hypothetical protein
MLSDPLPSRSAAWGVSTQDALQLPSNATLEESSIDILLWKIPLKSHADAEL